MGKFPHPFADDPVDEIQLATGGVYKSAPDESCDIYRLVARIRNNVTKDGSTLTALGIALCNTQAHQLFELHAFADRLKDEKLRRELRTILMRDEETPATFIRALMPARG